MIRDNLLLALGGIAANKVRSSLTMLSIAIGVFAVITLMAVAAGAAQGTQGQLDGLGSPRLISVYGGAGYGGEVWTGDGIAGERPEGDLADPGAGDVLTQEPDAFDSFDPAATAYVPAPPQPLSDADVAVLADPALTPGVEAVSGYHQSWGALTTTDGGYSDSDITGSNASYAKVSGLQVVEGAFFGAADVTGRGRVVVISETVRDGLGVGVGAEVSLQGLAFEVVGVVADTWPGAPSSYVPETTAQDVVTGPRVGYDQVLVLAQDEDSVEAAAEQVRATLREAHALGPTDPPDFEVYTRTADLAAVRAIMLILQVVAALIASIALFVAGIGVMNIMLVTVTERTREIGIRKAVGARKQHLMTQFLVEAMVLTTGGGLIGLAAGSATQLVSVQGFSPVVTPFSVGLALSFSVATGLFFGLYPANRAANLPPVQALRYE